MSIAPADDPVVEGRPADAGVPTAGARSPVVSDIPAAPVALCAVALGCGLQVNFGQYHPVALFWLTAAIAGTLLCVAKPDLRLFRALDSRRSVLLGSALAVQFLMQLTHSPGATGLLAGASDLLPFRVGIMLAAAVAVWGFTTTRRAYVAPLVCLLAVYTLLGVWVLRAAPDPGVDVCLFQRNAADALLRGENPYSITFKDPYRDSSGFYGAGISANGRLQFGYPYPPLSLLLIIPAHLLGDFRYAHLAAMEVAAALVALCRPGRVAFAAAALLLFTPRGFFVLEAGWTEPLAVMLLAGTVFAACRSRRSLPVPLGLLLAAKQYLPLALLSIPLLRRPSSITWKAFAVATVVMLPPALWDLPSFVHSVVLLQFRQPFRPDALSYLVPLSALGFGAPRAWVAFVATGLAGAIALRRCPRTPAGFAAAVALVLLAFFAFNKQAFCNYYHLVIGALCCAAGVADSPSDSRP